MVVINVCDSPATLPRRPNYWKVKLNYLYGAHARMRSCKWGDEGMAAGVIGLRQIMLKNLSYATVLLGIYTDCKHVGKSDVNCRCSE